MQQNAPEIVDHVEQKSLSSLRSIVGGAGGAEGSVLAFREGDGIVGLVRFAEGERSSLRSRVGVAERYLARSLVIEDIAIASGRDALLPGLLYLAAQHARVIGRGTIAMSAPPDEVLSLAALDRVRGLDRAHVAAQRVDIVAHRAFVGCSAGLRDALQGTFVKQVVAILDRWLAGFFQTEWFRAIADGTLSREQYAYTLANQHQYVRFTTRHIAAAVAASEDRSLRNHWRHHLEGEVDHEKIIEKDLQNLGVDPEFTMRAMVPQVSTLQFCVAQEAVVAFRRDPVMFMAPPFVAEGFSAHLDRKFLESLERCASSWGIKNPRLVTSFIGSHIDYDGGNDGHWAGTLSMIGKYLQSETQLQEFIAIAQLCMDSFARSYNAFVDDLAIFQATV